MREFFERIGLPHSVEEDIRRAMWAKFLLNVGINQTCMVFETTYQGALDTPEYFRMMSGAMQEVDVYKRQKQPPAPRRRAPPEW